MKYLLAFALIAVAMALPEPVRLLEPVQLAKAIAPLVVPQDVMDEVALKVTFVDAVEASEALETVDALKIVDAPVEDSFAVNFVEEAVNADAPETNAAEFAVNFVDEAVNIDAPTAEAPVEAVQFVDAPVESDASDYAVNFVDEAVNVDESPVQIKIADLPLLDSVVMPLLVPVFLGAPVESNDFAVKFVDVADVDEETPSYRPIKQYPNPMWR